MQLDNPRRSTRQRRVILEELCKLTSHPTAAELYEIVRQKIPKVSLGTVYRNLDLLGRTGSVSKLDFSDAESRFDGNSRPHDHLRCIRCGRVDDLPGPPLEIPASDTDDFRGYDVLGYRLELTGVCPDCRKQRENNDPPKETE